VRSIPITANEPAQGRISASHDARPCQAEPLYRQALEDPRKGPGRGASKPCGLYHLSALYVEKVVSLGEDAAAKRNRCAGRLPIS